jgi:hypothetical protein
MRLRGSETGMDRSTDTHIFLKKERGHPSRPRKRRENALDQGRSPSKVHCRPFSGDVDLLVDGTENSSTHSLSPTL